MSTGMIDLTSELQRKRWVHEGMVQGASKSFWSQFTGTSASSVVYQVNNENSGDGHTVVFDYDGNISGKAIKGKESATGKGEVKRKFSDKIVVERYRFVVDNGDKFDGVAIGDLSINEHSDSRKKLSDLWIRWKDQALFDAAQGNLNIDGETQQPTHIIDLGQGISVDDLIEIEKILKTSVGYTTGAVRRPLNPYQVGTSNDMSSDVWMMVMDSAMAASLRMNNDYQTIMSHADWRGSRNRNISGVIGKVGQLLIVEAGTFFGKTAGSKTGWGLHDTEVEMCGLRQYSGADPKTSAWSGTTGFDYSSSTMHSRAVIFGTGALQIAFGKQPDYKWQSSDFEIKSESALEVWMNVRKTKLKAEVKDYESAKVADIDHGVIAVDVQVN